MNHVLVTGAAGFIGHHVTRRLLDAGIPVCGVDNLDAYYDVRLKRDRLEQLRHEIGFRFVEGDIAAAQFLPELFQQNPFSHVVHLAAQAGVRYSLKNPQAYIQANLVGFSHVLEVCRMHAVQHLVYASSSSVYGTNQKIPFGEQDAADHPASLYAATKRANELMAHSYSHLFGLPTTGLRFFTVYGPWGRPDMAYFSFTRDILAGRPITLFNQGQMARDFTYIDDIAEGVVRLIAQPAQPNPAFDPMNPAPDSSSAPWRLYNIGNHQPVALETFVQILESLLGNRVQRDYLPMQAGDVKETFAQVDSLFEAVGYRPKTDLKTGLGHFVAWYRSYYGHKP